MEARIRASMLDGYDDCKRRTMGRVIKAVPNPPPQRLRVGTFFGSVVHAIVHAYIDNAGEIDLVAEADRQYGLELKELKYGILWDTMKNEAEVKHQAVAVVKRIQKSGLQELIDGGVEYCEQQFSSTIGRLLEDEPEFADNTIVVSGKLDLLTHKGTVVDWKTGMRLAAWPPQLALYGMLAEAEGAQVHWLCHYWIKRKTLELETFVYDYEESKAIAKSILRSMAKHYAAGETPAEVLGQVRPNPKSMLCSSDFCELHGTHLCQFGRQKKEV